jgi:hypothetical protein
MKWILNSTIFAAKIHLPATNWNQRKDASLSQYVAGFSARKI